MSIQRIPGGAVGRSRAVGFDKLLWLVSNATNPSAEFPAQVRQALAYLDDSLRAGGTDRAGLLSVQVFLVDIGTRPTFDEIWKEWIGPDPSAWPQRACIQAALAPGLLVELTAVAARP